MANKKIKVLHLISSMKRGGRERQMATIYKFSNNSDFECKIVCFNKTSNNYTDEMDMSGNLFYLTHKNPIYRLFEIRKIIKREKPTVIWTWGGFEASFGLILTIFSRLKHINGSIRHGIVRMNSKQIWRLMVLHLSKYIVANSLAGLRANYLKRGFVLYNGIDDNFFNTSDKPLNIDFKGLGITNDTIILVSVANLVPYKDYKTIIRALMILNESFQNFHYFIVGEGPERTSIENLIVQNDLSKKITILGLRKDIKEVLTSSNIFIHSSLGEGCSNAILEAMASGLPIIATDTGGTSEILNESYGFLFKFGDYQQLSEILKEIITDKNRLASMKRNAKNYAIEHFNIERMMKDYYTIISKVIR